MAETPMSPAERRQANRRRINAAWKPKTAKQHAPKAPSVESWWICDRETFAAQREQQQERMAQTRFGRQAVSMLKCDDYSGDEQKFRDGRKKAVEG